MSLELLLGLSGFIVFVLILVIMRGNNPEVMKRKIKKQLEAEGKNFVERRNQINEYRENDFVAGIAEWLGGKPEQTIKRRLRPDILGDTFVTEVEFAKNIHQAIGQPLVYSYWAEKDPMSVLLVADKKDESALKTIVPVLEHHEIAYFIIDVDLNAGEWSVRGDD